MNCVSGQRWIGLLAFVAGVVWLIAPTRADRPDVFDRSFGSVDTLDPKADGNPDSQACLDGLCWNPSEFITSCHRPLAWRYDCLVRFPSAISSGNSVNDLVAMEWHMARNEEGEIAKAPAVIVVHESGRQMAVGRAFALLLSRAGVHAFMIQLPGYGERRNADSQPTAGDLMRQTRQAVADVRRARDAVVNLPLVEANRITVQGTSLGGFVAATAAGLDDKFDAVFVMLAGGELLSVIENGQRDAANMREKLAAEGITGQKLAEIVYHVEPNRVAHRLTPNKTWLFSGRTDQVVPLANAKSWAKAVGLTQQHHVIMEADHYSGIVFLPKMVLQVRDEILK